MQNWGIKGKTRNIQCERAGQGSEGNWVFKSTYGEAKLNTKHMRWCKITQEVTKHINYSEGNLTGHSKHRRGWGKQEETKPEHPKQNTNIKQTLTEAQWLNNNKEIQKWSKT